MTIAPIVPTTRREPFDGPERTFELKFDGVRPIADTVDGRMISKRGNRMHRFEALLGLLPADFVLDGEIVALDEAGRPVFADLMFGRRPPILVAFEVLVACGEDVRALALKQLSTLDRRIRPFGLAGGEAGHVGHNYVRRTDGRVEALAGCEETTIDAGEAIIIEAPTAGGYGTPEER